MGIVTCDLDAIANDYSYYRDTYLLVETILRMQSDQPDSNVCDRYLSNFRPRPARYELSGGGKTYVSGLEYNLMQTIHHYSVKTTVLEVLPVCYRN